MDEFETWWRREDDGMLVRAEAPQHAASPTIITEKDQWRIDHETRTTGEILNAADAALSGESK